MLMMAPRPQSLLLALSLLFLREPSISIAQAPGDRTPECRTNPQFAADHVFPANWTLLLDSYDYYNLFDDSDTVFPSVWTSRSFDGDSAGWDSNTGGLCTNAIRSCTFQATQQPQDNWVFSQYISYQTALQVFMDVRYDFRECADPACSAYVTLYRYDTDGVVSDDMRTDRDNYQFLLGSEAESRLEQGDSTRGISETLTFTRNTDRGGFYLAFRDIGTCGNVNRVIVYYTVVPGRTETLLSCPDVPLPVSGSGTTSTLSCVCVNNTSGVGSLERTCDQNGVCNENQECACDPGLEFNSTTSMCTMCPAETYKAGVSNSSCEPCPMLSEARDAGSAICDCIPPNSRAGSDGPEVACRDRRLSTGAAVAITFFVTLIFVGVAAFLGGALVAYLCRDRIEKIF